VGRDADLVCAAGTMAEEVVQPEQAVSALASQWIEPTAVA
jgi:hypothetical protein